MTTSATMVPRALFTVHEVACLIGAHPREIEELSAQGQLDSVAAAWDTHRRFELREVERLLREQLDGHAGVEARRALVGLAYGELQVRADKLVEVPGLIATTSAFLDDELLDLVVEAADHYVNDELSLDEYDAWAARYGLPLGRDVMRRLAVFSWPQLRHRAIEELQDGP